MNWSQSRQPVKYGWMYTPNMSNQVVISTMFWSSLWMACMQRFVLFFRACKAGVITPLLFIVVPRYLNSSKASYDLKFVLFYGGLPLWRRTCMILVFLALIVIPMSVAFFATSVRVLFRRGAGAEGYVVCICFYVFYS